MLAFGTQLNVDLPNFKQRPDDRAVALSGAGWPELTISAGAVEPVALPYAWNSSEDAPVAIRIETDGDIDDRLPSRHWRLDVEDRVCVHWRAGDLSLRYAPGPQFTPELFQFLLLHNLLPMFLEIEGRRRVLHAAGVVQNGRATLIFGASFAGKSTLAHACQKRGLGFLGDDRVALLPHIEGAPQAFGSYPWCRPYREQLTLGDPVAHFVEGPVPVARIVTLEPVAADAPARLTELSGLAKFSAVAPARGFGLPFLSAAQFAFNAELSRGTPLFKLQVPRDLKRLNEVVDLLF